MLVPQGKYKVGLFMGFGPIHGFGYCEIILMRLYQKIQKSHRTVTYYI